MIKTYLLDINQINEKNFDVLFSSIKVYRQEKITKLSGKSMKFLSLGVELLIKKACDDFGINYDNVEINFNEFGKPFFKNEKYFFNTSHSGKYAICVISDKEVGIDIQEIKEYKEKVAKHCFSKKELQYVELSKDKADMFYRIWCLKESYSKCIGTGLGNDLNKLEVGGVDKDVYVNDDKNYQMYENRFDNYRIAWCVNVSCNMKEKYSSSISLIDLSNIKKE